MRYRALIILVLVGLLIPGVLGASEIQTIDIVDTEDDGFITPSNNMIDTSGLIHTSDPLMDVWAFWVFHDIDIEATDKLNNATLRIRSASGLPFDADNSFTLRGLEVNNLQDSWRPLPGMIKVLPQTSSYVNVNTSTWSGGAWYEIDVTNVVRELINHYEWDGDASGSGDSIGFITLAVADDTRYFYDYSGSPGYSAELVIGFGEDPPAPPAPPPAYENNTWEWVNETVTVVVNETDGSTQTIDIFKVTEYGAPEMIITQPNGYRLYNTSWKNNTAKTILPNLGGGGFQSNGAMELFAFMGDYMFIIGFNDTDDKTYIWYSNDEWATYLTSSITDEFPYLNHVGQVDAQGSIWADETGEPVLHTAFNHETDLDNTQTQILYVNFTLDPVTLNLTYGALANVTYGMNARQEYPDIYQEPDGTIHIAWVGKNGTANTVAQYRRRQANGTWLDAVRLSSDDVFGAVDPDVIAGNNSLALITWTKLNAGDWRLRWDVVFPNNSVGTAVGVGADRGVNDRRYVSVVVDRATGIAHASVQRDSVFDLYYHFKPVDNTTNYDVGTRISVGADRISYNTMAFDPANETLAVAFHNYDVPVRTQWNYWNIDDGPTAQNIDLITTSYVTYPHSSDYISLQAINVTWWLVWDNGTVIDGFDSYDDAIDGLEDITDPDPADPDPPGADYPATGPFTLFKTRLYILILGLALWLGPMMFLAYQYDRGLTAGQFAGAFIVMLIGLGLTLAIRQI